MTHTIALAHWVIYESGIFTTGPPRLKCESDFPFFFFHWTLVLFFYAPTQARLGFALLGWANLEIKNN